MEICFRKRIKECWNCCIRFSFNLCFLGARTPSLVGLGPPLESEKWDRSCPIRGPQQGTRKETSLLASLLLSEGFKVLPLAGNDSQPSRDARIYLVTQYQHREPLKFSLRTSEKSQGLSDKGSSVECHSSLHEFQFYMWTVKEVPWTWRCVLSEDAEVESQ